MSASFAESVQDARKAYQTGIDTLTSSGFLHTLRGKTICVVGSTGVLGQALVQVLSLANTHFTDRRIKIKGLARNTSNIDLVTSKDIQYLSAAAGSAEALAAVAASDYIVYVAGTTSLYRTQPLQTIETQTTTLNKTLEAAAGCAGFTFVSSARVYGRSMPDTPVGEDFQAAVPAMDLDNIYDCAKRLGEALCLWHNNSNNMNVTAVRLTNVYGIRERQQSRTVINDFITQAAGFGRIAIKGHPQSVRNHLSEIDAAQGLLRCLTLGTPGNAYNIGSGDHLTTQAVADLVAESMSKKLGSPIQVQGPPDEHLLQPNRQIVSIRKAQADLEYAPLHTFSQILPALIDAAQLSERESAGQLK